MNSNLTERAIAEAMKELLTKKPLHKISIRDLTEKCNINRKTFYYHFKDKDDLIEWIFMEEFYSCLDYNNLNTVWDFLIPLCNYFYENRLYYINALEDKDTSGFSRFFSNLIQPLLKKHFEEMFIKNEYYSLYADYVTSSLLIMIEIWLKNYEYIKPEIFIKIMNNSTHAIAEYILSQENKNI